MQIEYKVKLYYKIEFLEAVLLRLRTLADLTGGASSTIRFPDARSICVPFTSGEQNRSLELKYRYTAIYLDSKLIFPIDSPILNYLQAYNLEDRINTRDRSVSIGYIYIYIRLGDRYFELSFFGESSAINRLFLESEAMHTRFIDFMIKTHGIFGIVDIETSNLLITDLSRKLPRQSVALELDIAPAWDNYYFEDDVDCDIDLFVAECLQYI